MPERKQADPPADAYRELDDRPAMNARAQQNALESTWEESTWRQEKNIPEPSVFLLRMPTGHIIK